MRNKAVVFPFDGVALLHLNGHRIKLKIPHGNLRDSRCEDRCNGRCNNIGRSATIALAPEIPRANKECATDDDRKPTDAEKPKSQHSATSARLAFFAANRSMHILHILCRRAIHSLAMEVRDRVVWFHLRFASKPAVMRVPPARFGRGSWPYLFNEACSFFACAK